MSRLSIWSITTSCSTLLFTFGAIFQVSQANADSMSALIAQKSSQPDYSVRYNPANSAVPPAKISTRYTIQRAGDSASYRSNAGSNAQPSYSTNSASNNAYSRSNSFNNSYSNNSYSSQNSHIGNAQSNYRYPEVQRQAPSVIPAFLSGNYDNVDSKYLPLLSNAETQSSRAASEVISTARMRSGSVLRRAHGACVSTY